MMFFDRVKVLVIIAAFLLLTTMYKAQQVPIMSFGDAVRDQLRAKWWLLVLAGLEVVRQIHYVISERHAGWHHLWDNRVFGGWERQMSKMNPWLRYRLRRLFKWVVFVVLAGFVLSWKWGLNWFGAIAEAPGRFFEIMFGVPQGIPLFISLLLNMTFSLFYLVFFFGIFFIGGIETFRPGEVRTTFADVWGQDHVLPKVKENLDFLNRPQEIEAGGGYVPGGLLLWGPPGTGKTLMAEAMAGETGKPFVFVDPSSFVQTFLGVAPMKIKWLYRRLRKFALKYGGVVVFFDEADVLGNRGQLPDDFRRMTADSFEQLRWLSPAAREAVMSTYPAAVPTTDEPPRRGLVHRIIMGNMAGAGGMGTLQALLTEMSGLNKPRGFFSRRLRQFLGMKAKQPPKYRILHVFATNQPNALDQALLRPGRIDRMYKIGHPSLEGRIRTYWGYLNKIRHQITDEQVRRLATITRNATGASIKDLVNEALILSRRRGSDVVTWPDILNAKREKQIGPPEDVEYIDRERHAIAVHEACHAVVAYRVRKSMTIDFVTIEKASTYLGAVWSVPEDDQFGRWKREFEADIMVCLASIAGERMFFDDDSGAGVSGDLDQATTLSVLMEGMWGMGDTLVAQGAVMRILGGPAGGAPAAPQGGNGDRPGEETAKRFGDRVERRLQELLADTRRVLEENRGLVLAVAHALEVHKTIQGDDVTAIMEGTRGPNVDGRVYHAEEFRAAAEQYHAAAADAHRHHAKITIPLPAIVLAAPNGHLPPPPPSAVPAG
jgi:ATP-dependent Zn protease